ncbi:MAG: three-Cys-motif partner protein TcmP [Chloroflexi bacterium]|nr:three-Cys-motif partner protein TcmP [Chloroflexota bacterium]
MSWEVIQTAGRMKSIDMFLNFPVMDMNRNVLWINPSGTDAKDISRMNAFWGDDSWKGAAYQQTPNLFGEIVEVKRKGNEPIALAFSKRLRDVGGFAQVSKPLPMRNSQSNILYYLIFASQKQVAKSIMTDIITNIFNKYANWGIK